MITAGFEGDQKLVCGACDVTWQAEPGAPCWICTRPGTSAWTGPYWRTVQPMTGEYTMSHGDGDG